MENESIKPAVEAPKALVPVNNTSDHSTAFGVSIRGWIALIVILTVCAMSISKVDVKEPLYTLAGLIVGFYFGANPKKGAS